jgi:polar amino acid transport system substrate-binding protein
MDHRRRLVLSVGVAIAAADFFGCASSSSVSDAARHALAPTGSLRVGLYEGSPSSILSGGAVGHERGVGNDLGKALAERLGVPFQPVVFPKNTDVLAGIKAGTLDVTFTNASPERTRSMDFTPTFMDVEKGFLVGPGSRIGSLDEIKRPGLRIGVSEGSTTEGELGPQFPAALMVRTPTLKAAIGMLGAGKLDAFATNKAILFEMSDELPASRVLSGSWGMEHFAAAIPKGREAHLGIVSAFVANAVADGTVARAVARAGLRGAVAPARPWSP